MQAIYLDVLLGQMGERLGNRAINQKVADSIPGHAKLRIYLFVLCVFRYRHKTQII